MNRIKQFLDSDKGKDFLVALIVILVGIAGFGLGRLSKSSPNSSIRIEYQNQPESPLNRNFEPWNSVAQPVTALSGGISGGEVKKPFFASSKGSKYYPANCSAGKSIKTENRIYFDSRESAELAGYELSSSCR